MIYFAELFMTGGQHAAFNAAMLQVLTKSFPSQKINLFAAESHYQQLLAKEAAIAGTTYYPVPVVPNKSGSMGRWFSKFINEFIQLMNVLIRARKQSVGLVYFAFLSPFAQYVVSLYARYLLPKNQQLLITLHGLDILQPGKAQKRIDRIYAKLLKKAFHLQATRKRYLVLEERVADYLVQQQHLQPSAIVQISHPYTFKIPKPDRADTPLVFAHLGVARLAKHSQLFFELAKRFAAEVKAGKVIFQVIGPVLPELKAHVNPFVQYSDQETFLSQETYHQQCLRAHYAVFFYDQSNYALTSSGAVMDAIAYRIPILALRSPVFNQLLSVNSIFPGKLYDQVDVLSHAIEKLINGHPQTYQAFDEAFVALQHHYSIENVAQQFSEQIKYDE